MPERAERPKLTPKQLVELRTSIAQSLAGQVVPYSVLAERAKQKAKASR